MVSLGVSSTGGEFSLSQVFLKISNPKVKLTKDYHMLDFDLLHKAAVENNYSLIDLAQLLYCGLNII